MKFIDIEFGGQVFRARLLEERAPEAVAAIWDALPFEGRAVHAQISGAMFRMLEHVPTEATPADRMVGFQHPGLVMYFPAIREIAICYGQARFNGLTGPAPVIPLAEIGGDLAPLAKSGHALQFDGARPIAFRRSDDQTSPLAEAPVPKGRKIEVRLGDSVSTAVLLEEQSPKIAAEFARKLPLEGRGSNTYSSGPLTRFWQPDGGPQGETILHQGDDLDPAQVVMYPGYINYLPKVGFRGLRIAREATMMRSAMGGGGTPVVPLAKFLGDWSGFRAEADRILVDGAKPLSFRLLAE